MTSDLLDELLRAIREKRPAVLATRLPDGRQELLFPTEEDKTQAGAEWPMAAARRALVEDEAITEAFGDGSVFLRPYNPRVRLIVVGAVHIAAPLAELARPAGMDVVLVDPRTAFATADRFPGIELVHKWPEEALDTLRPDHRTAVVTLTHDEKLDDPALVAALSGPSFCIGALGSSRTHEKRTQRLRDQGVAEEDIARIQAPIGLSIGARTPAEIAVAILAEVVAHLRGAAQS